MGQLEVGQIVEVLRGKLKYSPEYTIGEQGEVTRIFKDGVVAVLFPSGSTHYYGSGELMIIQVYPLSSPFSDDK